MPGVRGAADRLLFVLDEMVAQAGASSWKELVLLVDADEVTQAGVKKALGADQFHVVAKVTATGAATFLDESDTLPAVVVLSFSLPDRDGHSVLEKVRKSYAGTRAAERAAELLDPKQEPKQEPKKKPKG